MLRVDLHEFIWAFVYALFAPLALLACTALVVVGGFLTFVGLGGLIAVVAGAVVALKALVRASREGLRRNPPEDFQSL